VIFVKLWSGGVMAFNGIDDLQEFDEGFSDAQMNLLVRVLQVLDQVPGAPSPPEVSIVGSAVHMGHGVDPVLRVQHQSRDGAVEVMIDANAHASFHAHHAGRADIGLAMLAAWAGGAQ